MEGIDGLLYHGGKGNLDVGDELHPAPSHVEDGCPICEARAAGRIVTVGEYRQWLMYSRDQKLARKLLAMLADAPADRPMDPPTGREAVYVTTSFDYALWYAARSRGDLYVVEPIGDLERSDEDHFPTWSCDKARITGVVRRGVRLTPKDRKRIERKWRRADAQAGGSF